MLKTFVDVLRDHANNKPDEVLYRILDSHCEAAETITYAGLDQRVRAVASHLSQYPAGERVLLMFQPGQDFIAGFFACQYAGMIAVPAYPPRMNQTLDRLEAMAQDSGAKIILTTQVLLERFHALDSEPTALDNLNWIASDQINLSDANLWSDPNLQPNAIAFLQYTSGSTGTPKGVMVSQANIMHNVHIIAKSFNNTPETKGFVWLPPYHDMGLIGGIIEPAFIGFEMNLMSPISFLQKPMRWLEVISRYKVNVSGGPNFAYQLCVDKAKPEQLEGLDLSSWSVAFCGAEPINVDTADNFYEKFKSIGLDRSAFFPCYGMAETTLIASGGPWKRVAPTITVDSKSLEQNKFIASDAADSKQLISSGQPCVDTKILIVNPETLNLCQDEEVGEIWIQGPSVTLGYWNDVEKTEQEFSAFTTDKQGPFLRTGDLGILKNNELFVTGRIKDVIIIRGQNHYPQDIEKTAGVAHSALRPGCGAAVMIKSDKEEQLIIIYEIDRIALREPLDRDELLSAIRDAVSKQHGLRVHDAVFIKPGKIPKTTSGKIRRQTCREYYLDEKFDACV